MPVRSQPESKKFVQDPYVSSHLISVTWRHIFVLNLMNRKFSAFFGPVVNTVYLKSWQNPELFKCTMKTLVLQTENLKSISGHLLKGKLASTIERALNGDYTYIFWVKLVLSEYGSHPVDSEHTVESLFWDYTEASSLYVLHSSRWQCPQFPDF